MQEFGGKYTLNVFSNLSEVDLLSIPIKETVFSFGDLFGFANVELINFFIHPQPFPKNLVKFETRIKDIFKSLGPRVVIHRTTGLAHGYIRSIVLSSTKYSFQLEHDWVFLKDRIRHSDMDIISVMDAHDIHHLRFNKRPNDLCTSDEWLEEEHFGDLSACRTPCCSNNPHFINNSVYLQRYLHLIDLKASGSMGIEQMLWGAPRSFIYGAKDYPETVRHIDGRARLRRIKSYIGRKGVDAMIRTGVAERAFKLHDLFKADRKAT